MQKKKKKERNKLRHLLKAHSRKNLKWIKDLNVRPETIKIIEENIGGKILNIACSNILSDVFSQARETKEKINKWDYIKLKSFLHTRGKSVSYTHLTLPTNNPWCRSRWSPYH